MDTLPLDTASPAVCEYLALVRLQVLTPLSLLINAAIVLICAAFASPSIGLIARQHPTTLSPRPILVALYVLVIYVGQIGYCLLLICARKAETKRTLVKAVGLVLVLANWTMALWAVAWVLQLFLVSTLLLGVLVLLLAYSNIALLVYHTPTTSRPLDIALIHAPLRFFLVLPLALLFPYSLFVTLGLTYSPNHPEQYDQHAWWGFAAVFAVNILGLAVIIARRDIVWAVAATWICVSEWSARPKPLPVLATTVLFTILHPLALVSAMVYDACVQPRRGPISLPADDDDDSDEGSPSSRQSGRRPREISEEGF